MEYCYDGQWTSICGNFHDEEASVVCKTLGFAPYGGNFFCLSEIFNLEFLSDVVYGSKYSFSGYYAINYVSCSSYATEDELQNCRVVPKSMSPSQCIAITSCTTPAAVKCYGMYIN